MVHLMRDSLGIRGTFTRSKYIRIIKKLDSVELVHLQDARKKAMK